jgi:hypothetical protein
VALLWRPAPRLAGDAVWLNRSARRRAGLSLGEATICPSSKWTQYEFLVVKEARRLAQRILSPAASPLACGAFPWASHGISTSAVSSSRFSAPRAPLCARQPYSMWL